jgi:hypothetical protein
LFSEAGGKMHEVIEEAFLMVASVMLAVTELEDAEIAAIYPMLHWGRYEDLPQTKGYAKIKHIFVAGEPVDKVTRNFFMSCCEPRIRAFTDRKK